MTVASELQIYRVCDHVYKDQMVYSLLMGCSKSKIKKYIENSQEGETGIAEKKAEAEAVIEGGTAKQVVL